MGCEKCHDTGWIRMPNGLAKCLHRKIKAIGAQYDASATLASLDAAQSGLARKLIEGYPKRGGIVIGHVGCGKTFVASAVANELLLKFNCRLVFAVVPVWFDRIRAGYQAPESYDVPFMTQQMLDADMVVLDDLGAEKPTDWTESELYKLVSERYALAKPIIVTTNCSLEMLREKIGMRVVDRLLGFGSPYLLPGKSRRWAFPGEQEKKENREVRA